MTRIAKFLLARNANGNTASTASRLRIEIAQALRAGQATRVVHLRKRLAELNGRTPKSAGFAPQFGI